MSTTASQLTAAGAGAIAVIALSGAEASSIVARVLASPKPVVIGQLMRANLIHPIARDPIDDALLLRIADNHYEFQTHGGSAVVAAILRALADAGALIAPPAEPCLLALSAARTMTAARLIAAQSDEGLRTWTAHWSAWLEGKSANDLWPLHSAVQWLLDRSATLSHLIDPPRIAIIGPPNAGKSTLANALLGRPVSITSDTPGTTRDWVDAIAVLRHNDVDLAVTLVDTAGVRTTHDPIEQESIARTHQQARAADVILLVFDATQPLSLSDQQLIAQYADRPAILIANKSDRAAAIPAKMLPISALQRQGLDQLMSAVLAQLGLAEVSITEPFAYGGVQRELLCNLATASDPAVARTFLARLANETTHHSHNV